MGKTIDRLTQTAEYFKAQHNGELPAVWEVSANVLRSYKAELEGAPTQTEAAPKQDLQSYFMEVPIRVVSIHGSTIGWELTATQLAHVIKQQHK